MVVQSTIFQYEVFNIKFRLRAYLDRDNILLMVATQNGEVITMYNREPTGVMKEKVRVDVNFPLCRKVKLNLEDGERELIPLVIKKNKLVIHKNKIKFKRLKKQEIINLGKLIIEIQHHQIDTDNTQ